MWILENRTPFAAERTWVRDKNGAEVWLVAVRGTFLIRADGSTQPAPKQAPVVRVPKYRGEPGKSSLLYESDLVLTKPATDVLLHGHAYAPGGKPATRVDVTMTVAGITKTLRVVGDRRFQPGLLGMGTTNPEPFETMPITYERAFGGTDQESDNPKHHGWDPRNPVGTGFAVLSSDLAGKPAPNVEHPTSSRPAGFGPIARNWSPRVELAGTYDEKWQQERLPLPPEDFDDRFYQCAPEDQRAAGYLQGGEPVELRNLTPGGLLAFHLPRVVLGFRTFFLDGEEVHHRANLHSVILEPDVPKVIVVWHTMLPCHAKGLKLHKTIVVQKRRVESAGDGRPRRRNRRTAV